MNLNYNVIYDKGRLEYERTSFNHTMIFIRTKSINLHMDRSIEDLEDELRRYASQTVIINEDE